MRDWRLGPAEGLDTAATESLLRDHIVEAWVGPVSDHDQRQQREAGPDALRLLPLLWPPGSGTGGGSAAQEITTPTAPTLLSLVVRSDHADHPMIRDLHQRLGQIPPQAEPGSAAETVGAT